MAKIKFAEWRKVGKVFYVKPPDWPKSTEYSCTEQETLIEWAHNHGYTLKDGNPVTVREPRQPRRDWQ